MKLVSPYLSIFLGVGDMNRIHSALSSVYFGGSVLLLVHFASLKAGIICRQLKQKIQYLCVYHLHVV